MRLSIMNGTNSNAPSINGTNMIVPTINGTNQVVPMNGTRRVVPMQGNGGRVYYVAPVSLLDIDQVPTNWIPTGLTDEQVLLLKTAYLMGDQRALNGKLGDILKKVGTVGLKAAQIVVPAVLAATGVGAPAAAAAAVGIGALNKKIATDQAKKTAAAAGLPAVKIAEAGKIAAESSQALSDMGISADPSVVADRSVMAADAGVKVKSGGVAGWWSGASNMQKGLVIGGAIILVGGGIYLYTRSKKKGRKRR